MFFSCRICTDKRVTQSLYNSTASCKFMWLHSNYSHLSDLHLLSSFVILQSVTFQSCNVVHHFPVRQIQILQIPVPQCPVLQIQVTQHGICRRRVSVHPSVCLCVCVCHTLASYENV